VTIEALGSIGELIAAIATIATLFYLAVQIRASTLVARAEAQRESQSGGIPAQLAIAQDPELAALLHKGLAGYPNLDPLEATRFSLLLPSLLNGAMLISRASQLGLATDDELEINRALIKRFLSTPGGRAWFNDNASVLPKSFTQFVDEELATP
jgi:hypothetical protein